MLEDFGDEFDGYVTDDGHSSNLQKVVEEKLDFQIKASRFKKAFMVKKWKAIVEKQADTVSK